MLENRLKVNRWEFWRRLFKHRSATVGLVIVMFVSMVAVFAPQLVPHDPLKQDILGALSPPSSEHPFGTDAMGRDLLSRVILGSRISVTVGLVVVLIAGTTGITSGLVAAYFEGWIDNVISRIIDLLLAFPSFLLALSVLTILGPSLFNAMLAVAIATIPSFARVARGAALAEKQRDHILAARVLGVKNGGIIFRHILPNTLAPLMVLATVSLAGARLTTASLSFLGLGAQPPTPEWGAILARGREYMRIAWWLTVFPGMAIAITVLALNLLGDGLRDLLDPRLRHRGQ